MYLQSSFIIKSCKKKGGVHNLIFHFLSVICGICRNVNILPNGTCYCMCLSAKNYPHKRFQNVSIYRFILPAKWKMLHSFSAYVCLIFLLITCYFCIILHRFLVQQNRKRLINRFYYSLYRAKFYWNIH